MSHQSLSGRHLYRLKLTPQAHITLAEARDPAPLQEIAMASRGKIFNETLDVWADDIKTDGFMP